MISTLDSQAATLPADLNHVRNLLRILGTGFVAQSQPAK